MQRKIHYPLQVFMCLMVVENFLAAFLKTHSSKGCKLYIVVKADLFECLKKNNPKQFIIML